MIFPKTHGLLWMDSNDATLGLQSRRLTHRFVAWGSREISINWRIDLLATSFHDLYWDFADRFIVATAMHHGAMLITADSKILGWQAGLSSQDARA